MWSLSKMDANVVRPWCDWSPRVWWVIELAASYLEMTTWIEGHSSIGPRLMIKSMSFNVLILLLLTAGCALRPIKMNYGTCETHQPADMKWDTIFSISASYGCIMNTPATIVIRIDFRMIRLLVSNFFEFVKSALKKGCTFFSKNVERFENSNWYDKQYEKKR